MSALTRESDKTADQIMSELVALGLATGNVKPEGMTIYHHGDRVGGPPGDRLLIVTASLERYSLETAHEAWFSIRNWAKVVVSVGGALRLRLDDQLRIGRQRGGGERSPAPLPDWYELAHLVYEHGPELNLDPDFPVYQYLPGRLEPYLNVAEALHLRQPR